ncbi:ribosomal protein S18-alanine N-acetyltransferase [Erysipelothrix aquatica]|uniref:ribosomal protein S18-alanine N-acetyltransferase n=1 Tax=Erysipelothrix aquatica TaxID=2683714 RepID=UPI001358BF05|nr:ribosomal protein S18-alanine N-acetyltransferase [Erysipelothrix aquatica]
MIRRATVQDLAKIIVIDTESLHNHWSLVSYNDAINNDNYWFFVYEENGATHGFVVALNLGAEAEILQIAVSSQQQRQGIGTRLLKHIEQEMQYRGSIFLEVASNNISARALYTNLGFEDITVRHNYYDDGTAAHILRKDLK